MLYGFKAENIEPLFYSCFAQIVYLFPSKEETEETTYNKHDPEPSQFYFLASFRKQGKEQRKTWGFNLPLVFFI